MNKPQTNFSLMNNNSPSQINKYIFMSRKKMEFSWSSIDFFKNMCVCVDLAIMLSNCRQCLGDRLSGGVEIFTV